MLGRIINASRFGARTWAWLGDFRLSLLRVAISCSNYVTLIPYFYRFTQGMATDSVPGW